LLVNLLQDHGITFPNDYEWAAKMLNALALHKVYDPSKTGEEVRTGIGSVVSTRQRSKSGFISRGAKVLYQELRGDR
jgi:hypothetical protein